MSGNIIIKRIRDNIILVCCICVLLVSYLYHIDKSNIIYHLGDEFGYWANAAFIYGYDWSGVASYNTYYSFGYSFLLTPLFFIERFETRYQVALLLNIFLQVISFLLLNNIFCSIYKTVKKNVITVICAVAVLYSSNIFFAKTTLAESCLSFCYVFLVYIIYKISETHKRIWYIIAGIVSIFIFFVHMRAIGVAISVFLYFIFEMIENKRVGKTFLLTVCLMMILVVSLFIFKEYIINNIYLSNTTVKINDFSGQSGKVMLLFSIEGVVLFVKSVLGKIYYLFASTFLIGAWGILWIGYRVKEMILKFVKKENVGTESKIAFFMACSTMSTFVVSAIYMIRESDVIDHLIYGRYNEFLFAPLLAVGLLECIQNKYKNKHKMFLIICFVFLLLTWFVSHEFSKVTNPSIREVNIAGIARLSYNGETCLYQHWELVIALKVILVAALFYIGMLSSKWMKYFSIIGIGIIWIICGNFVLDYQLKYREGYYTNKEIIDYVKKNEIVNITYLLNENYVYFDSLRPDVLQFMCPELIITYKNINEITLDDELVFFVKKDRFDETIFDGYVLVKSSNDFNLYVKIE